MAFLLFLLWYLLLFIVIFYPRVLVALRVSKGAYEVGGIIYFIHKETEATLGYMTDWKPPWQRRDLKWNLWLQGSFPVLPRITNNMGVKKTETWIPCFHSVPREYMATNRNDCTQLCGFLPGFKGWAYEIPWSELTMLTYVIKLLSSSIFFFFFFLKRQTYSDRCVHLMI